MRSRLYAFAMTLIASICVAGLVQAEEIRHGTLVIETPWTRATPPNAMTAASYMVIRNTGDAADRLLGGSAAFAGKVEIHEMSMTDGMMRMREVAGGLVIPPGESVTLKPGGLHVMMMGMTDSLREGETVAITFDFEKAGPVTLDLPVMPLGAREGPGS